jgi:predicted RND superfamily exporter protein
LDLKKRNIEIERDKIEKVVSAAISGKEPGKDALQNAFEKITAYLLSDESEVEFTSKKETEAITLPIVDAIKKDGKISKKQIAAIIRSKNKSNSSDDILFLSETLDRIVFEAIGEARVENSINQILDFIPSPPEELKPLLRRDLKGDLWAMNENLITLSKNEYQRFLSDFDVPIVKENKVSFTHTGLVPILKKMEGELTPTQVGSVLFALIFVTIILSIIFRSILVGFISVVPIILTVLVNFAIIGYLKIGLDSFIAMIASITIGLGTDYSIHFTSHFRRELSILKNIPEALKRTFSTTGVAIVINAFSVGLGFVVLMLGPCQHVRMFGRLTALTMLTSTIFTLAVLPALTLMFKPKYLRKADFD